jgi:hypothetical protein
MGQEKDIVSVVVPDKNVVVLPDESVVSFVHEDTSVVVIPEVNHVSSEETQIHVVTMGQVGPAGYGDSNYNRPTPVPTTIGGVTAGHTFVGSVQDALDTLFYPYQAPAFTSFSFSQTSPLEVGATIAAGTKSFTWATSNSANVEADTIGIVDVTGGGTLLSSGANDGTEALAVGAITKTSATGHTWRISATNTNAGAFTRDFTVSWQWRRYYGESVTDTADESLIEGLRVSGLSSNFTGTFAFLGGGYKWICYPTVWGLKTTFKDTATNLDVAMQAAVTVSVTNTFGVVQNYYAHRTTNILGGAINIAVS